MSQLFDRFGRLLRSMASTSAREPDFDDRDMREAWEELEGFLEGEPAATRTEPLFIPERLRPDFELLGVPFGAVPELVQQGYKRELRAHHPDRHMHDPAAQARATEKTREIIAAYGRIRAWEKERL